MAALLIVGSILGRSMRSSREVTAVIPKEDAVRQPPETLDVTWNWLSRNAARNTYDPNGFTKENGIIRYRSGTVSSLQGLDLSAHNGEIDWEQVSGAGIDFVILQLGYRGYTKGNLNVDTAFFHNLDDATAHGIAVGVYFFSQATSADEAKEEAEYIVKTLAGCKLDLPVYFDWETVQNGGRTDSVDQEQLSSYALAFCKTIEDAGFKAGIYFNQHAGYYSYNLDVLEDYSFWLAEYDSVPAFYFDFDLWQYSADGTVAGISGQVDRNLLFVRAD
ncbi:MAG: glycoside hydrolase family 25 protein [Oscillospiraceae bacterium]|nr:glycoside hydrolase family 25 protein [Oscillospiraceae bacterium]